MNSQNGKAFAYDRDLLNHYSTEVKRNAEALSTTLPKIRDFETFIEQKAALIKALQSIKDLAMIHGFECVEAVAEKMEGRIREYQHDDSEPVEKLVARLGRANEVLCQLIEKTDEGEAQRLMSKSEYVMDFAIDSLHIDVQTKPNAASRDELAPANGASLPPKHDELSDRIAGPQSMWEAEDRDHNFDIREPVLQVVEVMEENGVHEIVASPRMIGSEAVFESEDETLTAALDEIAVQKTIHELDRLSAAIERLYISADGATGVQEIRDTCVTLKTTGEELGCRPFNDIVLPLEMVAKKCLQDEDDSALVLQTIAHAEQSLRSYLTAPHAGSNDLKALQAELDTLLSLYEGQSSEGFENRGATYSFAYDDDEEKDFVLPPPLPIFMRLKKIFGMA
jgi:chemotaxis protein histidine kinase CheA